MNNLTIEQSAANIEAAYKKRQELTEAVLEVESETYVAESAFKLARYGVLDRHREDIKALGANEELREVAITIELADQYKALNSVRLKLMYAKSDLEKARLECSMHRSLFEHLKLSMESEKPVVFDSYLGRELTATEAKEVGL
jgi:hypothetical protein